MVPILLTSTTEVPNISSTAFKLQDRIYKLTVLWSVTVKMNVSFPMENAHSLDILSSSQVPYLVRLITCNTSRGLRQPAPQQGVS
jgi:hypothetical protein